MNKREAILTAIEHTDKALAAVMSHKEHADRHVADTLTAQRAWLLAQLIKIEDDAPIPAPARQEEP